MSFNSLVGYNRNFATGMMGGTAWGSPFGNTCMGMLGGAQGAARNSLMGGLLGSLLGSMTGAGGNPFGALFGGMMGGLLASQLAGHRQGGFASPYHPSHQGASCYPSFGGGGFGGCHLGGYGQGGAGRSFGQPHWCGPQVNVNFNFNFGHHCPPRCCAQPRRQACRDGQLKQKKKGKPIEYTTSGGYKVHVNKHTITVTDPSGKNTVQHWGDPHEKLNGKHIKDWQTKQRSVVLGDGTKITMNATGPKGVTLGTSIYDGRQNVQIDNKKNEVTHHSFNWNDTRAREQKQYDGETSIFKTASDGAGIYNNIYTEDENFGITRTYQKLGRTGGNANPKKVYDFYDDPTLKHT